TLVTDDWSTFSRQTTATVAHQRDARETGRRDLVRRTVGGRLDAAPGELVVGDVVVVEVAACVVGHREAAPTRESDDVPRGHERAALVYALVGPPGNGASRNGETVLCRAGDVPLYDILARDDVPAERALDAAVVIVVDAAALDASDGTEIDLHALVGCARDVAVDDDVLCGAVCVRLPGIRIRAECVATRRSENRHRFDPIAPRVGADDAERVGLALARGVRLQASREGEAAYHVVRSIDTKQPETAGIHGEGNPAGLRVVV